MSRFDFVVYDELAKAKAKEAKELYARLDKWCETNLPNGRAKSLVLTALEESFMWVGKSIRDEQILERSNPVIPPAAE